MKLGGVFLKRFSAKRLKCDPPKSTRKSPRNTHPKAFRTQASPLSFLVPVKVKVRPLNEVFIKNAVLPNAILASTEVPITTLAPLPVAAPIQVQEIGLTLLTSDVIRPDSKLKQSIESFLADQRSPHTQRAYGKDLKRFVQFLAGRKLDRGTEQLSRTTLIAYKDSLLVEGLEHTTIDRHLATLRSFFRWLVDDGLLIKSPADGVRFLNPKRLSTTQGFSDEEVQRLLKIPDLHTRSGSLHYAILMVLFYCGLRRSELCELRTVNISQERGHSILRLRGKGNNERIIVLIPSVKSALKHFFNITGREPTEDRYLFTPIKNNRTGQLDKALDPSMIFYIVRKYARKAGIAHRVSPHSCRATAISNARDHNVPDRAIQEFAGWASPDMITRYDKRKSSIEKSAARAIDYGSEDRLSGKDSIPIQKTPMTDTVSEDVAASIKDDGEEALLVLLREKSLAKSARDMPRK